MFNYLKGNVEEASENTLVLDVGGVGFELTVSAFCVAEIVKQKSLVKIPVHMSVREDEIKLFGFKNLAEKNMFLKLIAITGIGPKAAVSILSGIALDELIVSILNEDTRNLNKIKGIGKKTAERIVLELKDKLNEEYANIEIEAGNKSAPTNIEKEAALALISLGFTKNEALSAVGKVYKGGLSLEDVIMKALKG